MNDFLNTNITLKGMEDKGKTVTLIDTNDTKWTVWKADYKNPSQDSEAYGSLKNYGIGDTFGISYGERTEQFVNNQGKTINFTRRTIYQIMPTVANPTQSPSKPETGRSEANRGQSGASRNWDKEAYEKCCSIWATAVLERGQDPVVSIDSGAFWRLFQAIRADGDKRFSPEPAGKAALRQRFGQEQVAPDIAEMAEQMEQEELNVEDIPFN